MSVGYIVVEPDLHIERVPELLLREQSILWPPVHGMPEKHPPQPAAYTNVNDLYHRHRLTDTEIDVYVWSRRDPNALPESVVAAVRRRAAEEGAFLDRIDEFEYRGHLVSAQVQSVAIASKTPEHPARTSNAAWHVTIDGVTSESFPASPDDEEPEIRMRLMHLIDSL